MLDVTRSLAQVIDLTQILETITREACIALDCDRATLFQYDPKRRELYTRVATKLEINEIRHDLAQGITGFVARTREMANVPDPHQDPRWNSSVDRKTGYQTRNILAAPLVSPRDDSLLGVLQLLNKNTGAFDRFDEELTEALGQHAAVAIDRARLVDELRQRHEVEASLELARQVQRGFMPAELPTVQGYEVSVWWYPNQAVGGDYCDVISLEDGRIGLVVADVSGHGLGPSLIMASVRAALRALLMEHSAPQFLLESLDRSISCDLQHGKFVTMVLAFLDPVEHRVKFSNAGHAPALHYAVADDSFSVLESTGTPLGVLDTPSFPEGPPFVMAPGDVLLLCTDGIVEATNARDQCFGYGRLQSVVRQCRDAPAEKLVRQLADEVEAYYVGDNPSDDLTILAVRRIPQS